MKQTAVEWLIEQIVKFRLVPEGTNADNVLFHKAKAMEKEHLYNFYMQGGVDAIMEADRNVEQYYNETFKSE